jgi:rubrerythrin
MAISKELRIDLDVLERVVAEGDSDKASAYINTETAEVLLAKNLLEAEIQNRQRFLKFPSEQLLSIDEQAIEKWIENTLEMINQTHNEDFMLQAKTQLEQAMKQIDRVHSVTIALVDLQGKGLADNLYDSWLEFVDREQVSNIRNWLFSKGIHLNS